MQKQNIIYLPIGEVKPYKNNPRKNHDAIDAVAASIKEYGFRSPIIITEDKTVINGHTRLAAAKKLGFDSVPCIVATGLSEEQIRQYRIIDNKTSEYAKWDQDLLGMELADLDFNLDFDFDFSGDLKKINQWAHEKRLCNLKDRPKIRKAVDGYYQSMYAVGKEGKALEDIKTPGHVKFIASTAAEFLTCALGKNLKDTGWCITTTPRRRHKDFHFATEVCYEISDQLGIPFYSDAIITSSRNRITPEFELIKFPAERNVVLYDDIVTTGVTVNTSRRLLEETGYTVFSLISIDNH